MHSQTIVHRFKRRAAREFAMQSLESEQKKYHLGASTTANVLQQERNLAVAENSLIVAQAMYGKDRAALSQTWPTRSITRNQRGDAVSGKVTSMPVIPGLEAPKNTKSPVFRLQPNNSNSRNSNSSSALRHMRLAYGGAKKSLILKAISLQVQTLCFWCDLFFYRSATRSSRSKNSGNEIAAASAPWITLSLLARRAATAKAMAMR